MAVTEINESIRKIREEVSRLYDLVEESYEIGKRDGKKELINKIEKYFELKEKGEINEK